MCAEDAFPLKASPFDRPNRGEVIRGGFSEHPMEPKLAQTPGRSEPQRLRGDPPSSSLRKDGDCKSGNFLVFAELQVE